MTAEQEQPGRHERNRSGYWRAMTIQLPPADLTLCSACGETLVDMGLRPSPTGGQDWVFMCSGCRRDVVHQHVPAV